MAMMVCQRCGKETARRSTRQKYCKPCSIDAHRECKRRYSQSESGKESIRNRRHTEAYRKQAREYRRSDAGKASSRKYSQSESGKESIRNRQRKYEKTCRKRINECHRKYYANKKASEEFFMTVGAFGEIVKHAG